MATYYLAVDMGASSGRLILGHMENGKIQLEEVHRFENGMVKKDGELCWEFDRIFREIVTGMKKCREMGKIPVSMGVDTWGVDFVLLDKDEKVLGNTVGYRDHRNDGMDEEVYKTISLEDLYARTGIQKAIFNTIYQLMAVKKKTSGISGAGRDHASCTGLFPLSADWREDERIYRGNYRTACESAYNGLGLRID